MHKHHIIPRHMGGSDDPSNLKELTVEEHADAHRLLFEQHGHWQDYVAWRALSGQISFEEATKEAIRRAQTGRKHTLEHVEKNRQAHLGKKIADSHKQKLSEMASNPDVWMRLLESGKSFRFKAGEPRHPNAGVKKGYKQSDEHKKKIAAAKKAHWDNHPEAKKAAADRASQQHAQKRIALR